MPFQYRNSDLVIGNIKEKDFVTYGRRMMSSLIRCFTSIFTHAMYYMACLVTRQGLYAFLQTMRGEHSHLWWFSGFLQKYFEEQELKCQTLVGTQLTCYIFGGNSPNECFVGLKQESQWWNEVSLGLSFILLPLTQDKNINILQTMKLHPAGCSF